MATKEEKEAAKAEKKAAKARTAEEEKAQLAAETPEGNDMAKEQVKAQEAAQKEGAEKPRRERGRSETVALKANDHRKGFTLRNLSQFPLFVKLGDGASAVVNDMQLDPHNASTEGGTDTYTMPEDLKYTGNVSVFGTELNYKVEENKAKKEEEVV